MSETHDHGHSHDGDDAAEPITERTHDNSWSANLEKPRYAENPGLAARDALDAIDHTTAGNHVNLVSHSDLGHPEEFLFDVLSNADADLDWEYVEQCGCGGHVTRVHVE